MADIISRVKSRFTTSRQTTLTQMAVGVKDSYFMTEIGAMKTAIPSQFADLIVVGLIRDAIAEKIASSADLSLILLLLNFFPTDVGALRLLTNYILHWSADELNITAYYVRGNIVSHKYGFNQLGTIAIDLIARSDLPIRFCDSTNLQDEARWSHFAVGTISKTGEYSGQYKWRVSRTVVTLKRGMPELNGMVSVDRRCWTALFEQWHMSPMQWPTKGAATPALITRLRVPGLLGPSRWDWPISLSLSLLISLSRIFPLPCMRSNWPLV